MQSDWKNRYDAAIEAAQRAGQLALKYFDSDVNVEWKENQSPVTVADREAEQLLRKSLLGHFPEDAFLGEEFGEQPGSTGYRWIVDPIDGTRNFVRSIPMWGTLVGLEYQGTPIAGVISIPNLNQVYRALKGDGAYRDDRRIGVSQVEELKDAQLFFSGVSWFTTGNCKNLFLNLVNQTQRQRGFGDFYGYLLVAQGSGEIMMDYGVHSWDVAAIQPIVEEAGGVFTDWHGNATIHRPDMLTANAKLHAKVLEIVKDNLPPGFDPSNEQNAQHIT